MRRRRAPIVLDEEGAPPSSETVTPPPARTADATFAITGMTCASCAAVIEKVLAKQPGVVTATVNLASERLAVTYDPSVLGTHDIVAAVEAAGYDAAPINEVPAMSESGHAVLALTGMTCASCAAVIEKTLQRLRGVSSANVNLATEIATVDFDPALVGPDELITAVTAAGYGAMLRVETVGLAGEGADEASEAAKAHYEHTVFLTWMAFSLAIPTALVSMVPVLMESVPMAVATFLANTFGGAWDPMMIGKYIPFLLATPVQFYCGAQFYRGFWHALKRRTGNMDTLIAIGTSAAYFYSLAATFVPSLAAEPVFYETSALLISFVLLGKLLEARAKGRTGEAIKKLMGLAAKTARVVRGGVEVDVPVEEVVAGDTVVVRPGEKVPVDGILHRGPLLGRRVDADRRVHPGGEERRRHRHRRDAGKCCATMMQWEEADVAALAGELIQTGLATPNRYNHLTLNPALCPYLRGRLDAAEREALTARWVEAMREYVEFLVQQQQPERRTRGDADGAGAAEPVCAARPRAARGGGGGDD